MRACPVHSRPRRAFLLRSIAAGAGLLLPASAGAGELREAQGSVAINGRAAVRGATVRPLDVVTTGAGGSAVVIMSRDVLLLRPSTELEILGKAKSAVLTGLRMLTGGVLGVFGKGRERQLLTATATIGIRGTGVYLEASPEQTYVCTCYGEVVIEDQHRSEKRLVLAGYHTPNVVYAQMKDGTMMQKAQFANHTDAELIRLEKLVGRRPGFVKP
ncbi:MAG TPA: iron dicitrate transport regulator FecR [Burkholderiales bacterium]|nr:iron dicitrate transport regulator FecR [Burkholderiales bacterium]